MFPDINAMTIDEIMEMVNGIEEKLDRGQEVSKDEREFLIVLYEKYSRAIIHTVRAFALINATLHDRLTRINNIVENKVG